MSRAGMDMSLRDGFPVCPVIIHRLGRLWLSGGIERGEMATESAMAVRACRPTVLFSWPQARARDHVKKATILRAKRSAGTACSAAAEVELPYRSGRQSFSPTTLFTVGWHHPCPIIRSRWWLFPSTREHGCHTAHPDRYQRRWPIQSSPIHRQPARRETS